MTTKDAAIMKTCRKCHIEKHILEFGILNSRADGRRSDCAECYRTSRREYLRSNPEIRRRMNLSYRTQEKKYRLGKAVRWAIKKGTIIRTPCYICGETKVEAHHCDYNKPLDVVFMCIKHHNAWHRLFLAEKLISNDFIGKPHTPWNGKTKLPRSTIEEVITKYLAGERSKLLAEQYGISQRTVSRFILNHRKSICQTSEAKHEKD